LDDAETGGGGVLKAERRDGVLWLIKSDPKTNNGISLAMADALTGVLTAARDDASIRAVVIDAEGSGFHNAAVMVTEIKPNLADLTPEDFETIAAAGHRLGGLIAALPMPVIGVVRSGALGGGLELLLRSDLLYCTHASRFKLPEVNFGFVAAWGGTQWAGRQMSYRKAQEFLLLGETMSGRDAEESGLVTRSFADVGALDRHVAHVLDRLRLCAPGSLRGTKQCLRAVWEGSWQEGEAVEHREELKAMATGDFVRALAALEGRNDFDYVAGKPRPKGGAR
jgi:enoyl-CoA hydratase/carnithine racemase